MSRRAKVSYAGLTGMVDNRNGAVNLPPELVPDG